MTQAQDAAISRSLNVQLGLVMTILAGMSAFGGGGGLCRLETA